MRKWIRFVLVMGLLLAFMNVLVTYSYIKEMNSLELHYDADDYFLMIDQKHHIMGFYGDDGVTPMKHMGCRQKIPDGVYDADVVYGMGIILRGCDFDVAINLKGGSLKWVEENFPSGKPALVYGGH